MDYNDACGGNELLGGGMVVDLVWCGGIQCGNGGVWVWGVVLGGGECLGER